MKRPLLMMVRDNNGNWWGFEVRADPTHIAEWRAAGLEVYEVDATIPKWAAAVGLAPLVAALQRAWQWARIW